MNGNYCIGITVLFKCNKAKLKITARDAQLICPNTCSYCRQEFPVDGKDGSPLSMSQYYNLLSWCRSPGRDIDSYVSGLQPGK